MKERFPSQNNDNWDALDPGPRTDEEAELASSRSSTDMAERDRFDSWIDQPLATVADLFRQRSNMSIPDRGRIEWAATKEFHRRLDLALHRFVVFDEILVHDLPKPLRTSYCLQAEAGLPPPPLLIPTEPTSFRGTADDLITQGRAKPFRYSVDPATGEALLRVCSPDEFNSAMQEFFCALQNRNDWHTSWPY
jgi:hypothetical protein